jgi:ATP adenylyltransferase
MAEFPQNLWATWRMEYIRSLVEEEELGCFICRYRQEPACDDQNHVLWRTQHSIVIFNRWPYTSGHVLVCPVVHKQDLHELTEMELNELIHLTRDVKIVLQEVVKCQGFNAGMNFGRCAGAGLPGHLHMHVVPRWSGDVSFMSVVGDVRLVFESMDDILRRCREASKRLGLPKPVTAPPG